MNPRRTDNLAEHEPADEPAPSSDRQPVMTVKLPADIVDGIDGAPVEVEGEAVLRWLETGEGDPWPASWDSDRASAEAWRPWAQRRARPRPVP